MGLRTLSDLAHTDPAALMKRPRFGRLTLHQTRGLLELLLGCTWEAAAAAARGLPTGGEADTRRESQGASVAPEHGLTVTAQVELAAMGLLESWTALLAEVPERQRQVVRQRAGLDGPRPKKVRELCASAGVAGKAGVRRLEQRALAHILRAHAWRAQVVQRVDAALTGGAVALASLARDPWWAAMAARPRALDYFGKRALGGPFRVVEVDGERFAARCRQDAVDEAWRRLRAAADGLPVPQPLDAYRALVAPLAPRIGPVLAEALFERLRRERLVADGRDPARVIGRAKGRVDVRHAALLAFLQDSPSPVPLRTVKARFGPLLPLERPEILYFPGRCIGLARHFPDHARWAARIVRAAIEVLKSAPSRSFHARELHELLGAKLRLPPWLTHLHVGSLLLRSDRVRRLGRWQFALPGAAEVSTPPEMRERVVRILRDHGEPMPKGALVAELRRSSNARDTALEIYFSQPGVLRCAPGLYGLVDRDLPGGRKAAAKAADRIAALLEQRGRGLTVTALHVELRALGAVHARWTEAMSLGALRIDARFRIRPGNGAIGLARWESVRIPTAAEVVRGCLQRGGGTVLVETVRRRLREQRGETLSRWRLSTIANRLGAGLQGPWLAPMQKRSPPVPASSVKRSKNPTPAR